eukprot:1139264-Pelagomonas_calceolata.AAC.5
MAVSMPVWLQVAPAPGAAVGQGQAVPATARDAVQGGRGAGGAGLSSGAIHAAPGAWQCVGCGVYETSCALLCTHVQLYELVREQQLVLNVKCTRHLVLGVSLRRLVAVYSSKCMAVHLYKWNVYALASLTSWFQGVLSKLMG